MGTLYQALKLVHLFAVVIFLGNIITGLFWKAHGDRSRDPRIMANTMDGIIRADRWFTIPGVVVITVAGVAAAMRAGLPLLHTGWILWSIVAFALSGIAFAWRVAPLQKRLLAMARDEATFDWAAYRAMSLRWELWGLFATVMPGVAVVLMVMKPHL